jgi:hypothetical protein
LTLTFHSLKELITYHLRIWVSSSYFSINLPSENFPSFSLVLMDYCDFWVQLKREQQVQQQLLLHQYQQQQLQLAEQHEKELQNHIKVSLATIL